MIPYDYPPKTWAWLFKTNDVVSNFSLKFQTLLSHNMPIFFVEKMRETFALQKLLSFFELKSFSHFLNKNISVFGCKVVKHLAS